MPGLYLGGQAGASSKPNMSGYNVQASTASQAAFGSGYSSGGNASSTNALLPNDPFGIALWASVGAAVLLLVIRHGLPG